MEQLPTWQAHAGRGWFEVRARYKTIHVNDNAAHNLAAPRSMGPRCFSFTDKGMQMAFSAAPSLVRNGALVPQQVLLRLAYERD